MAQLLAADLRAECRGVIRRDALIANRNSLGTDAMLIDLPADAGDAMVINEVYKSGVAVLRFGLKKGVFTTVAWTR